jgi:hypothetical protein
MPRKSTTNSDIKASLARIDACIAVMEDRSKRLNLREEALPGSAHQRSTLSLIKGGRDGA